MHIWRNRGLRTLFVVALVLGVTSVPAAIASSAPISDNMDIEPLDQWHFEHNASYGAGGFEYNQGFALSPQNNAWLAATNGWSALRRYIRIPAGNDPNIYDLCTASIYIKPAVNDSVTFNLEVLDPYTYQYIALRQVTLLKGGYKQVSVSWRSEFDYVYVRFALLSNNGYYKKARLDNFYVFCQNTPL